MPEHRIKLRVHKRQSLLQATARELARIQTMVQRARLRGTTDKLVVRKVVTKTLAKNIRDDDFTFQIPNKAAKAALDSIQEAHEASLKC